MNERPARSNDAEDVSAILKEAPRQKGLPREPRTMWGCVRAKNGAAAAAVALEEAAEQVYVLYLSDVVRNPSSGEKRRRTHESSRLCVYVLTMGEKEKEQWRRGRKASQVSDTVNDDRIIGRNALCGVSYLLRVIIFPYAFSILQVPRISTGKSRGQPTFCRYKSISRNPDEGILLRNL